MKSSFFDLSLVNRSPNHKSKFFFLMVLSNYRMNRLYFSCLLGIVDDYESI